MVGSDSEDLPPEAASTEVGVTSVQMTSIMEALKQVDGDAVDGGGCCCQMPEEAFLHEEEVPDTADDEEGAADDEERPNEGNNCQHASMASGLRRFVAQRAGQRPSTVGVKSMMLSGCVILLGTAFPGLPRRA